MFRLFPYKIDFLKNHINFQPTPVEPKMQEAHCHAWEHFDIPGLAKQRSQEPQNAFLASNRGEIR